MSAQNPTHPAASLRDDLEEVGWTVNEFATRLGVSRNTASRLLNGRCAISPEVALALEAHRLEQRRLLDAPPGQLRPSDGPPRTGGGSCRRIAGALCAGALGL